MKQFSNKNIEDPTKSIIPYILHCCYDDDYRWLVFICARYMEWWDWDDCVYMSFALIILR